MSLPVNKIVQGDCTEIMQAWPADSIDLVVTSPPYWGLRSYGPETVRIWGGDPGCEHEWEERVKHRSAGGPQVPQSINPREVSVVKAQRDTISNLCSKCGAWRGSLGLEPHPQMFIDHLVEICREIKRVLKPTGTFWLNLGDSYYGGHGQKHGIGDTKEQDLKVRGVLSQNPYDVRRDALSHNIFDTRHYLAAEQVHASSLKIRGCMRDLISHHSTEDCSHQTTPLQSSFSILGRLKDAIHESAPSLFFPSSTMRESSRQLLDHKMLDDNHQVSVFPSMLQTFYDDALVFVHKLDGALRRSCGTQDIVSLCEELVRRTLYISESCLLVSSWVNPPNIKPQGTKKGWLQPKQKLMMPSRVAIALQDDGWVLRSDVIWHKPNHMPSSVQDRLTCAYEHIFLFVQSRKYYFDLDTIRTPHQGRASGNKERTYLPDPRQNGREHFGRSFPWVPTVKGKNPGDVWRIPTNPFTGAHFATFPPKLIEPIIKAGSPKQVCKKCGNPRERIIETVRPKLNPSTSYRGEESWIHHGEGKSTLRATQFTQRKTVGWTDCGCDAGWTPGIVLDPFGGSGTVGQVARKLGRRFILIEINPEYIEIAEQRVRGKYRAPSPGATTLI